LAFEVLKQLTLNTYQLTFLLVVASVASSHISIASIRSLIYIPHFLTNKNLFFTIPDFLLVELVALSGSQWQRE
jgi:hypothetical protein